MADYFSSESNSTGRRILRIMARVFREVAKELGGNEFSPRIRFEASRGQISNLGELTDLRQQALAYRLVASWHTLLWFVVVPLYFRRPPKGNEDAPGQLRLIVTQHPNTPRPAWWLLAMQNAGNYIDGAKLLSDEELESNLKVIVREMCTRPLEDKSQLDIVSNLEMVLRLYGARLWRRADQFQRNYGTWMVCDLDGQIPENVPPKEILRGARVLREYVVNLYLGELRLLAERISRIAPPETALSAEKIHFGGQVEQRINLINNALVATTRGLEKPNAFKSEEEFLQALETLSHEVKRIGEGLASDLDVLTAKARVFGFSFLDMFPRVNAQALRPLGASIFQIKAGITLPESEAEKIKAIKSIFSLPAASLDPESLNSGDFWLYQCLEAFYEVRRQNGRPLCFIISNFEQVSDEFLLEMLLRNVGFKTDDFSIVHLHEGDAPVREAARLSADTVKAAPNKTSEYVVMFGGSDMQRECGCAGQWELARAIQRSGAELRALGKIPIIFYGRADTFFRWGGPLDEFRQAQPDNETKCIVLVQGDDVIRRRLTYQQADLHRAHSWAPSKTPDPIFFEENAKKFDAVFRPAIESYKALTNSTEFSTFFFEATPASIISSINRSVRPKSRSGGVGQKETQSPKWSEWRAIITIQAGAVSGYIPQLLGAGTALASADEETRKLFCRMWRESRWFHYWMRGLIYEYARVDMETLAFRGGEKHRNIIEVIRKDFELGLSVFPLIVNQSELPHPNRWRASNILRHNVAKMEATYGRDLASAHREALKSGYMAILASLGENG